MTEGIIFCYSSVAYIGYNFLNIIENNIKTILIVLKRVNMNDIIMIAYVFHF